METDILSDVFLETAGVFTPAMASQISLSRRRVAYLRQTGVVMRVCGAALTLACAEVTTEQRAIGALLTWSDGVICLRTAGRLHGFPVDDHGETDVLVPNGRRPSNGLVPRQWSVRPVDVEQRGPIRLTDRRTTLADLLGRLSETEAWGLLAWLWTRDQITEEDLAAQVDERWHLYGIVRLRAMLAAVHDGALSVGEVRLHEFLRDRGFVGWRGDQKIRRFGTFGRIVARADVLFVELNVILEFDGAIAHGDETAEADAARDELLTDLGYIVVHVTWADIYERPHELVKTIKGALAEGSRRRGVVSDQR